MSCKKITFFIILFFLFLSGCSDKPLTKHDVVGNGDDIAEVFGKDDSDN